MRGVDREMEATALRFGERARKGQTDPVTVWSPRRVRGSTLEDPISIIDDAVSLVGDSNCDTAVDRMRGESDLTRPVSLGIVDEHVDDVCDGSPRHAGAGELVGDVESEGSPTLGKAAVPTFFYVGEKWVKIKWVPVSRRVTGKCEQIIDGRFETVDLNERLAERLVLVRSRRIEFCLEDETKTCEWCPQLMRCVG